jgi:hypothetical protein
MSEKKLCGLGPGFGNRSIDKPENFPFAVLDLSFVIAWPV